MLKKQQIYPIEVKLKAVNMYIEEKIGSTTIAKTLGLNRCDRVLLWVRRYKEFGIDGLEEQRGKSKGNNKGKHGKTNLTLEQKNIRLTAEVEYLKKLLQIGRL